MSMLHRLLAFCARLRGDDTLAGAQGHIIPGDATMLDRDSFQNIIEVVRCCVQAGRADLIEAALTDRLHVGEVSAKIASEQAARPAAQPAAAASGSIFGGPTPAQRDQLATVLEKRFREMYGAKPAG
jgi:hypothetical protein